jgi:surface polysaccharide O-acyltransferase-like enzyme
MEKIKKYNPAVDALRIIAILAVIFIHTTTRTIQISTQNFQIIPWSLFLNQIFRFAVPLFFMISGFVLELNHHANESYFTYFKKRINRIFIPYIFWSGIYYFFIHTGEKETFLQALLAGSASYQLYFIPSILIFYLIFPFIHNFYKFLGSIWITILFGLIQIVILYYDYNVHPLRLFSPEQTALFNYFVFYAGIVLANNVERFTSFIRRWRLLFLSGTLIFAFSVFYEGQSLYIKTHNYLYFYSQWRPSVLIYTFFLAGFLYYIFDRNIIRVSIIKALSKLSFFVFFIHVIILEVLWRLIGVKIFNPQFAKDLWWDPLYFLAVALVSFSIAFLAHKIPHLRKITG